jgi:hypothetical protein
MVLSTLNTGFVAYEPELTAIKEAAKGQGVLSGLTPSERGAGANMSIDVALGYCICAGTLESEAGVTNIVIGAAHATLDRIDLIVYDATGDIPIVIKGIASSNPNPADRSDENDVILAMVLVSAGVTQINNSDIVDCRAFVYGNAGVHTASDWKFNNSADIYLYSDYGSTQKIKLDGGDGSAVFAGDVDIGVNELTAGSINRASGSLTLEIGGTAEQTITDASTTFGGNVLLGANGIGNDASIITVASGVAGATTFAGNVYLGANSLGNSGACLSFATGAAGLATLAGNLKTQGFSGQYLLHSSSATISTSAFFLRGATVSDVTLTIPSSIVTEGRVLAFQHARAATGTLTIATQGSEKIDGADTVASTANKSHLILISDGSDWYIVSNTGFS